MPIIVQRDFNFVSNKSRDFNSTNNKKILTLQAPLKDLNSATNSKKIEQLC
jgi:hypothetical protein